MRALFLLLFGAISAFPDALQVGIKAGVPLTDSVTALRSPNFGFNSNTKRYIIGPMLQVNLPAGFAIEVDALYRRLNYDSSVSLAADVLTNSRTTGNSWEFPLLLKYRFHFPLARPFLAAGPAWDTLSGLKQTVTSTLASGGITTPFTTSNPAELRKKTAAGFVLGAGVEIKAAFLHISPEVRYTNWGSQHFRDAVGGLLHSNRNQAEFLVGFTF